LSYSTVINRKNIHFIAMHTPKTLSADKLKQSK